MTPLFPQVCSTLCPPLPPTLSIYPAGLAGFPKGATLVQPPTICTCIIPSFSATRVTSPVKPSLISCIRVGCPPVSFHSICELTSFIKTFTIVNGVTYTKIGNREARKDTEKMSSSLVWVMKCLFSHTKVTRVPTLTGLSR